MWSGVGLSVLGLLCLHSLVHGQDAVEVQPGVLIFCDDPTVETAVSSAMNKFNEGISTGHKLALFQILSATKSENGSDTLYSLQFTTRRSDCPAGDPKPWTDCDYLPIDRKPIPCNAVVSMTETETETKEVHCHIEDHVKEGRAQCMGCPEEIEENSEDLKVPVSVSISKYNSMSDSTHLFRLNDIMHATRQVVAGLRYKFSFDMRRTNCAKAEHKDLHDCCAPDEETVEYARCNTTVDVAPWRLEPPQAQLECEPGRLPMMFTRRRPPGWSPLRNLLFKCIPSTSPSPSSSPSPSPSPPPSPNPSQGTVKEESSEEDTGTPKPTASSDSPFHCPSKPWKPFNPVHSEPKAPTKAPEESTAQPDGVFTDTDLLG
ncbi:kininogen-1-like [Sphaeramia orbicularis]|uniref:kininogen-1-like n=1 Tax=Sphaeramia orbicularis TaxID=375764 RepID=UPI001180B005|nr:kininogen-1-like [Sphaeramia orbicularis]